MIWNFLTQSLQPMCKILELYDVSSDIIIWLFLITVSLLQQHMYTNIRFLFVDSRFLFVDSSFFHISLNDSQLIIYKNGFSSTDVSIMRWAVLSNFMSSACSICRVISWDRKNWFTCNYFLCIAEFQSNAHLKFPWNSIFQFFQFINMNSFILHHD